MRKSSTRPDVMKPTTVYIINHTHWDREWFLTSVYTSRWIAGLIDHISALAQKNPSFHFFLDGQTLVIEDLRKVNPDYREKVEGLVSAGNLQIGPYYCQPDWRMTCGEALLRNLLYGRRDLQRFGGEADTGWLVDTFGHISQAPQIHSLFGIDSVYVWRGAPIMVPYFNWLGPDGSSLFTINLFGGYRNLYGVTQVPEIAVSRLEAEIEKLAPYYPTGELPLFDGYDLEDNPEDPVRFYDESGAGIPETIRIYGAEPGSFARAIRQQGLELKSITGELNSGKYGAVFPGTLSSRIYLKRMARDCEHILYGVCEPLGVLASQKGRAYPGDQYEKWSRILLQNAVHDCISGVSIDQVHEKMEYSYHQVFDAMKADIQESLDVILAGFAPGIYALSTNPMHIESWLPARDSLFHVETGGIGAWRTSEQIPIQKLAREIETFTWKNEHYIAHIRQDGTVTVGSAILGELRIYEERGDAYSEETGRFLGKLQPVGSLQIEQQSDRHCVLRIDGSFSSENVRVEASIRLTFDPSPLIGWEVELDGRGTDYRVEMVFETGQAGQDIAGMPFDIVQRFPVDRDLLPRQLDDRLAAVLLGQRELIENRTFPFQEFVAVLGESKSLVVFAQGLHAYQTDGDGTIRLPLNRAVEWLTRPDLRSRAGDAGPFFYVPDARSERRVTHRLAALISEPGVTDAEILAYNAAFQNPPLLVETEAEGDRVEWNFFQESLPLSSLHIAEGQILARLYNPTSSSHPLSKTYTQTDVFGQSQSEVSSIPARKIITISLGAAQAQEQESARVCARILNPPQWNVGENRGLPDPAVIQELSEKIARLEEQISEIGQKLPGASKRDRYILQHRIYALQREALECRLSKRLNEIKLKMKGRLTQEYLYVPDEEIEAIGRELNSLRIKRRIYDYVIRAI